MMNRHEEVMNILMSLYDEDIIPMWNEYCRENSDYDNELIPMSDFNELNRVDTIDDLLEFLKKFIRSDFDPYADYFYYDGYGNLCSCNDIYDVVILDDIATHIINTYNTYGNEELENLMEQFEEEDDELED